MTLTLDHEMVLVTAHTAASILGVTTQDILDRVDRGELVSFNVGSGSRRELRIWTQSIASRLPMAMAPDLVVDQVANSLFGRRAEISVIEAGRRCSIDRSILYRMHYRGEIAFGAVGIPRTTWRDYLSRTFQGCPPSPSRCVAGQHDGGPNQ